MNNAIKVSLLLSLLWMAPMFLCSQQVADTTYVPDIPDPAYVSGEGPVVFIDEGHFNFHTKNGRYRAFATLLERDGYVVDPYSGPFKRKNLMKGRILVISNALNEINATGWYLPTPSAFTKTEIEAVKQWVKGGGRLFLIADHMPMDGAATELAAQFGFGFTNGFAMDTLNQGPDFSQCRTEPLWRARSQKAGAALKLSVRSYHLPVRDSGSLRMPHPFSHSTAIS